MRGRLSASIALLLWAASASPVRAEDRRNPAESAPIAITHATVFVPGGRAPLEDATVLVASGKITAVGPQVAVPRGSVFIDGRGKIVTPGFIEASSDVGVIDVDQEAQTDETDVHGNFAPALRMIDGYNPRSALVPIARAGGVTSVIVAPRRGLLEGQSAFVELTGDRVDEAVVIPALAQHARVDEEVAQSSAGTRGGMWMLLREAIEDARFYGAHRAQYDANGVRRLSLRRAELEALQPVVRGEQPLVVEAHRASDIEAALQLGRDYRLRLILQGASEAWMLADAIARARVPVVLDPMANLPARFDRLHARADNAALLAAAGVRVVISTFSAHEARLLWQHAGNAVRLGMDHDAAIRAVTEAPAEAFGLRGYGKIEPGAVADLVVWSGDPLQTSTIAEHVIVRGKEQPLETRQALLLERYRSIHRGQVRGP